MTASELTVDAIEFMSAGREMDAAIAQHVLGLDVVCMDWPCGFQPDSCNREAAKYREYDRWDFEPHPVYKPEDGLWPPRKRREVFPNYYSAERLAEADSELRCYMEEELEREICDVEPVPHYSEDIAAAWEVAEWLRKWHGQFSLVAGLQWHCMHEEMKPDWGSGETMPLAVCRAALLTVLKEAANR